jgi:plasmid stabilization system protein ParE
LRRPIIWTDEAVAHLEAIVDYVEAFDSSAARRLGARLVEVAKALPSFPSGRA